MSPSSSDPTEALDSRTGWLIVVVGFLLLFTLWGMIFTFTVYAGSLGATFGLSPLQTSAVFSTGLFVFFLVGGVVGVLADRTVYRRVIAASALLLVLGVGLFQFATSFGGLLLAFSLICAAAGPTYVLVLSVVPQWFEVYEGRAMGVTVVGNGLGVQVLPFVWLWLLERTTIREAFLVIGGSGVAIMLIAARTFRRPGGVDHGPSTAVDVAWIRSLVGEGRFVAAWIGLVFVWAWYFVLSGGMVDILTSAGISRPVAASAFGLVGGISIVSRIGSGGLADVIGPRRTFTMGITLAATGLFLLSVTATVPTMFVAIATFGVGLGTIAALYAPIVIGAFGSTNPTAVTGVFTFANVVAGFLGPLAVNALAIASGGYGLPLAALAVLTLVGTGLFYWGTVSTVDSTSD